jgi:hypothetical protein
MVKRAKRNQNGKGFLDVIKKVGGFLKDTKILSTVGSMIPHAGVQTGARLLGSIGLGKGKGKKKGQKGKGFNLGLFGAKDMNLYKKKTQGGSGANNMTLHGVRSTARPAIVPIVKL